MKDNIAKDFINNLEVLFDISKDTEAREGVKYIATEALKGVIMDFLNKAADEVALKDVDYDSYIKYHACDTVEPQNVEFDKESILNLKKHL